MHYMTGEIFRVLQNGGISESDYKIMDKLVDWLAIQVESEDLINKTQKMMIDQLHYTAEQNLNKIRQMYISKLYNDVRECIFLVNIINLQTRESLEIFKSQFLSIEGCLHNLKPKNDFDAFANQTESFSDHNKTAKKEGLRESSTNSYAETADLLFHVACDIYPTRSKIGKYFLKLRDI